MKRIWAFVFAWCIVLVGLQAGQQADEVSAIVRENDSAWIDSVNREAYAIFRTDPLRTRELARLSLRESRALGYKRGEGKAYNYLGMASHITGQYDSAIWYYNLALGVFESLSDSLNLAKVLNNSALLRTHQEYFQLALSHHFQSLEIAQALNDTTGILHSFNNIGIIYEKLKEYGKALEFYRAGIALQHGKNNLEQFLYYALGNIGVIHLLTHQPDSAIHYFNKTLPYFRQANDNYGLAETYSYLGQANLSTGKWPMAYRMFDQSDVYAGKINAGKMIRDNEYYRAVLDFQQKRYTLAEKRFIRLLQEAKSGQVANMEMDCNFYLSQIDSISGDYLSALNRFQSGVRLRDSLNSSTLQRQVAELTIRYEILQKDREITMLKKGREIQELAVSKKTAQRNFLLIILFMALTLILIAVFSYRSIRKNNFHLAMKNKEIASMNTELLAQHENLENMVEIRTAELKTAKEQAEESDRLKSTFLATISHELRTPLNAILGFSQLIDESTPMPMVLKYVDRIRQGGTNLFELIQDLLNISLIESGGTTVSRTTVPLNGFLQELALQVKTELERNGKTHIQVTRSLPCGEEECWLSTDRELLQQIFTNLLKNAVKFSYDGVIELGYKIDLQGEVSEIVFFVSDTGIGIPEEALGFIFDLFRQADETHTRLYGGTGVGLTVAKRLVELLGGDITVDSRVGEGSTFRFTHPYLPATPEAGTGPSLPEKARQPGSSGPLILIAEDEDSNHEFLDIVLKAGGYETLRARNGKEAVDLVEGHPDISMVLMDLKMPVMTGFEATTRIRKLNPALPVMALTAYANPDDLREARTAGCNSIITKPVREAELMERIRKYLHHN